MPSHQGDHPAPATGIPALAGSGRRVLVAVASALECGAVVGGADRGGARTPAAWASAPLGGWGELLVTGVGKANASGAVARVLDPARHSGVLCVGICGSLPGGPGIGAVVLATRSVFADEGIQTPEGYQDCREMGFALSPGVCDAFAPTAGWRTILAPLSDAEGVIATVSTCSGTDELAARVVSRTGAVAEAMEGAAVGLAAARIDPRLPFAELRVVSNTTGDRAGQRWELAGALATLGRVLGRHHD